MRLNGHAEETLIKIDGSLHVRDKQRELREGFHRKRWLSGLREKARRQSHCRKRERKLSTCDIGHESSFAVWECIKLPQRERNTRSTILLAPFVLLVFLSLR